MRGHLQHRLINHLYIQKVGFLRSDAPFRDSSLSNQNNSFCFSIEYESNGSKQCETRVITTAERRKDCHSKTIWWQECTTRSAPMRFMTTQKRFLRRSVSSSGREMAQGDDRPFLECSENSIFSIVKLGLGLIQLWFFDQFHHRPSVRISLSRHHSCCSYYKRGLPLCFLPHLFIPRFLTQSSLSPFFSINHPYLMYFRRPRLVHHQQHPVWMSLFGFWIERQKSSHGWPCWVVSDHAVFSSEQLQPLVMHNLHESHISHLDWNEFTFSGNSNPFTMSLPHNELGLAQELNWISYRTLRSNT
jgi:hypothetical protein